MSRGGAILSVATNINRHAEVAALAKLFPSERIGTTVFSARVRKDGSFAMGKPCANCMKFILWSGCKKVIWTDSNGNLIKVRLSNGT